MKILWICLFQISILAHSQQNHVVISQVYGGGGNSGALFTHDFIELFNPAAQAIDLNGFSLQYSSAAGTSWNSIILSGIIPAKKYFLVQLAGGTNGSMLPTPDVTGTINLSATSGKIALVQGNFPLSGSCPISPLIIDFLGYGTANCSEGQPAGQGNSTLALIRKNSGCIDTDNNSVDFITGVPLPKNLASPIGDCSIMNSNLPIYFSNEKCVFQNDKLEISWTNDLEFEVESYLIEFSKNGFEFEPVQKILPEKNDGGRVDYSFHINHFPVLSFVRIKGTELNGSITFSKIMKVNQPFHTEEIHVFPNPARNLLTLEINGLKNGKHLVSIHNSLGLKVKESILHVSGSTNFDIEVSYLSPGLYFINLNGGLAGKFLKY